MPALHTLSTTTSDDATQASDAVECALALLDLGSSEWSRALARLDTLRSPSIVRATLPDRVEAMVRLDRHDDALTAQRAFCAWAASSGSGSAWLRVRAACARALVSEGESAVVLYEQALCVAGDAFPFDQARIRLLLGEHLRRMRRRADARDELRAALALFEQAHAGPWVERARAELLASGETARRRDVATLDELTPQQLQIARLVAEGLSNKEIARRFFLSPRTVDNHLRNVFSKLGLSSRTQLAGRILLEPAYAHVEHPRKLAA